jgi:hypothetical protein
MATMDKTKEATTEGKTGKTDGREKYPRKKILDIFNGWFLVQPSVYPPNLNKLIVCKEAKIVPKKKQEIVGITKEDYDFYNAVDAKYSTILYEFVPMGKRQTKLEVNGDYILRIKTIQKTPWSFGSCHACWKSKKRNFTNTTRTPHPYDAEINDPNLSVLGGCGHVICNECVMSVEKYTQGKDRCSPCPYCGHANAFPRDLRMWCISEQVERNHRRIMQVKDMKRMKDQTGLSPKAIHFSADGNITYEL